MKKAPKVEIVGMYKGSWIRVTGEVKEDLRREAREAMMKANYAALSRMYTVDDNLMTVFCFEKVSATIYSQTADPQKIL